jgi:conjugal transfer pilus assembly protein TraF
MHRWLWLLLVIPMAVQAVGRQGIFYYEYPVEKEEAEELPEPQAPRQSFKTATEAMDFLQKNYTEALNKAILTRSQEDHLKERLLHVLYTDLAESYQDSAQSFVEHMPQVNYTLRHPVDHIARREHDVREDALRDERIKQLSKDHGLFFFYAAKCPQCRAFAPTIQRFAKRHGFSIIPISVDGGVLPEFPETKMNQGQAQQLNIQSLPAVVAVNPNQQPLAPILVGYGNISIKALSDQLNKHYLQQKGQMRYEILG